MQVTLNPTNLDPRKIDQVVRVLQNDGLAIIPTDTIYAMCCAINSRKGFERLCKFKNVEPSKASFSMLLNTISEISTYTKQFDRSVFRLLNKSLPGPYTFILPCSQAVCNVFSPKKKSIGIRLPSHTVPQMIVEKLGAPLLAASLHDGDEIIKYSTDPSMIYEQFATMADIIVDAGYGKNTGSTIIDLCGAQPVLVRQGLGSIDVLQ